MDCKQLEMLVPGRYVVAVSGGVDSMVLLHMAQNNPNFQVVVAHYDHGIRQDSREDRTLVQSYSTSHNLQFEFEEGTLGVTTSEATARQARYNFLRRIRKYYNARAILTAHHQDDLLETVIINLLRGTSWRGLSPFHSWNDLQRPLLNHTKKQLITYAKAKNVPWRHDPTNDNQQYLRNYVRHSIIPKMGKQQKAKWLQIIVRQKNLNNLIEQELDDVVQAAASSSHSAALLPRYLLTMAPRSVALELLQQTIKYKTGNTLERPLVEKALLFAKTAEPAKRFELSKAWCLVSLRQAVIVELRPGVIS